MSTDFNHAESLGKVLSHLQSIEFLARAFLAKKNGQEEFPGDHHKKGDFVTLNFLTNYDTLEQILNEYNKHAKNEYNVDVEKLKELRDGLAHGRVLAKAHDNTFKLYKFSRPGKNDTQVEITHLTCMDKNWFEESMIFTREEITKIAKSSKEEMLNLIPTEFEII